MEPHRSRIYAGEIRGCVQPAARDAREAELLDVASAAQQLQPQHVAYRDAPVHECLVECPPQRAAGAERPPRRARVAEIRELGDVTTLRGPNVMAQLEERIAARKDDADA